MHFTQLIFRQRWCLCHLTPHVSAPNQLPFCNLHTSVGSRTMNCFFCVRNLLVLTLLSAASLRSNHATPQILLDKQHLIPCLVEHCSTHLISGLLLLFSSVFSTLHLEVSWQTNLKMSLPCLKPARKLLMLTTPKLHPQSGLALLRFQPPLLPTQHPAYTFPTRIPLHPSVPDTGHNVYWPCPLQSHS